jgi:two-component system, sensor histidine kinase RegB
VTFPEPPPNLKLIEMTTELKPNLRRPELGYQRLLRLRWLSVVGQIAICAVFSFGFQIVLPLGFLAACIAFTAASNLGATWLRRRLVPRAATVCFLLILLDTFILTAMLYRTGGAHNPFSALYLLHITLAAILLPPWGPWILLGLSGLGFWILFASPHELTRASGGTCCSDMTAHLHGMLLSMVIAGAGIAYFVSRLSASLNLQRRELEKARALAVRQEHFASLATLSAGLAHELATPLGTIAVVSTDLEKQACETCGSGSCLEDIRLIRSEVARCRKILDRVGHEALHMGSSDRSMVNLHTLPDLLRPYLNPDYFRRIEFHQTGGATSIRVPETSLLQSLAVLLKNACEASPADQPVSLHVDATTDGTRFTVTDSGSGIEPRLVARLGEPFFTTKEPGFGMGLGLFLVRTFAERMKGKLEIDSIPNRGTTMHLYFPSNPEVSDA